MPQPRKGESEKEFINRCIPYVSKEHGDWDNDKVIAVCYSLWKNRDKHDEQRELFNLDDGYIDCKIGDNNCFTFITVHFSGVTLNFLLILK